MAGCADDDVARHKTLTVKFTYWCRCESFYSFFRPQDRPSQCMVFPEILGKDFVDEVIRIVLIHFDFFENNSALTFDILGLEDGTKHQVTQYVQRYRKMFIKDLDVKANALLGSE